MRKISDILSDILSNAEGLKNDIIMFQEEGGGGGGECCCQSTSSSKDNLQ